MKHLLTHGAWPAAVLAGTLAFALAGSPVAPLAAVGLTSGVAGAAGSDSGKASPCIACISGFVIGAGTTVAGLAVFIAAHPELAIGCFAACAKAVT